MFENLRRGRHKYGLSQYLRRSYKAKINKLFFNSRMNDLISAFRDVGIEEGMTICVHSSLSRLGYIDGGANAIIDALQTVAGKEGRVMMPAFSMGGNMADQIHRGGTFDVRHTPSSVGIIPETFRRRTDVLRSCHPTNSVAVWGKDAASLVRGHENSTTPFGYDTPYGKLASREDAYVLMLDTHLHSLLHHIQERVDFPNLFLPGESKVSIVDGGGMTIPVTTRVMRPRVPYFVAIPGPDNSKPAWAILHDFGLMFPSRRYNEVRQLGYNFDGFPALRHRRKDLESAGILKSRRLGRGEIGLLHIRSFLDLIQPEFEELIARYRPYYDPEKIAAMDLPYS